MSEGTVGDLVKKLRAMHGHLSAKDRRVVVECIGALADLARQLWKATHDARHQVPRQAGGYELRKVADGVDGRHPDQSQVLEDPDGTGI